MGVAGCGKSTVMAALAERLGWPTAEGDEFHSPENVAKMASGRPLTDEDREPWLRSLAAWIGESEGADVGEGVGEGADVGAAAGAPRGAPRGAAQGAGGSAIVTCSSLKRAYRDLLRDGHPSVWFVHLVVPAVELDGRLRRRRGHYMPPALLASQLETLEPLVRDEPGLSVSAEGPLDGVVDLIIEALKQRI
jgi:gluconokinase